MSIATLRTALYAAIEGITPTSAPGIRYTRQLHARSPEDMGRLDVVPTRGVWLEVGAPQDAGLVFAAPITRALHTLTLHVTYADADTTWADDGDLGALIAAEDSAQLISALVPASAWSSASTDVEVSQDVEAEDIVDGDRVVGRVMRLRLTAEVDA